MFRGCLSDTYRDLGDYFQTHKRLEEARDAFVASMAANNNPMAHAKYAWTLCQVSGETQREKRVISIDITVGLLGPNLSLCGCLDRTCLFFCCLDRTCLFFGCLDRTCLFFGCLDRTCLFCGCVDRTRLFLGANTDERCKPVHAHKHHCLRLLATARWSLAING
jgi:hypothetical protein